VTVGRADGTVAEVIRDKIGANTSVIMYFQNTGHLPAKFNWGSQGPWWGLAFIPKIPGGFIEIKSDKPFTPMWAGVTRKTGGVGGSGTITIGGNSLYSVPIIQLPAQQLNKMLTETEPPLQLSGVLDYCDSLGKYSCRNFTLQYFREPLNRFALVFEEECPAFQTKIRNPDPNIDYFPPCEMAARERKMEEDARRKH